MTLTQHIEKLRAALFSTLPQLHLINVKEAEEALDVKPELTESEYILLVEIGILALLNPEFREHIADQTDMRFNELFSLLEKIQKNANPVEEIEEKPEKVPENA